MQVCGTRNHTVYTIIIIVRLRTMMQMHDGIASWNNTHVVQCEHDNIAHRHRNRTSIDSAVSANIWNMCVSVESVESESPIVVVVVVAEHTNQQHILRKHATSVRACSRTLGPWRAARLYGIGKLYLERVYAFSALCGCV